MKKSLYVFALILCLGFIFTGCSPFESEGQVIIDASEVKTNLDYNEDLDLSNLIVKAKKGNSEVTLTTGTSETSKRIYKIDMGGFDKTKSGKYTITISYQDYKSATFVVKVNKQIVGYEIVGSFRTAYICNDKFDLSGVKLKVIYADNSSEEKPIDKNEISVEIYSFATSGQKEIVAMYKGVAYTLNATVYDYKVKNITIVVPRKDKYLLGEEISLDGGIVNIEYDNLPDDMDGILPSSVPFDNASVNISGFDTTSIGEKYVEVEYFGKTAKYQINVETPRITKVELVAPNKVEYKINEDMDLTGGYLKVTYAQEVDESILPKRFELTDSNVEISNFNTSAQGNCDVVVKYKGFANKFTIKVIPPKMTGFTVGGIEKTTYNLNETLDLTGGFIETIKTYGEGDRITLEGDYSAKGIIISGFDTTTVGDKTIKVTYNGFDYTFIITVVATIE